jgi:hypothetical protein
MAPPVNTRSASFSALPEATIASQSCKRTSSCNDLSQKRQKVEEEELSPTQPYEASNTPPVSLEPEAGPGYHEPQRRYPPVTMCDTIIGFDGKNFISEHGRAAFVSDDQILKKHAVKFIPTEIGDTVIAITPEGFYAVLQQATRACVPAAITALSLFHKGQPIFHEMKTFNITSDEMTLFLIKKAGFDPVVHELSGCAFEKIARLSVLLEKGPGLLNLCANGGGHTVVVYKLRISRYKITFADPCHGWVVSVDWRVFAQWISSTFIQFGKPPQKASQ